MEFNAQQMREEALIKKGRYQFEVLDAREKRSAKGTDMINLKLRLQAQGRDILYWTSLFLLPKMFWQIEHFCKSTGMPEKIDEGRLMAQDCLGKQGEIEIDHKVNKDTGEIEVYAKDFVKQESEIDVVHKDLNDDVPSFT